MFYFWAIPPLILFGSEQSWVFYFKLVLYIFLLQESGLFFLEIIFTKLIKVEKSYRVSSFFPLEIFISLALFSFLFYFLSLLEPGSNAIKYCILFIAYAIVISKIFDFLKNLNLNKIKISWNFAINYNLHIIYVIFWSMLVYVLKEI